MDLNYLGSVNTTFLVLPGMKERCHGHIVFVSSMAGQVCITIDMPIDFILWEMFLVKIVTGLDVKPLLWVFRQYTPTL